MTVIPPWMLEQLKQIDLPPAHDVITTIERLYRTHDIGKILFDQEVARLPEILRQKLIQGSLLAVGSLLSSEFNGAVVKVPGSNDKYVVQLPFGGPMLSEFFCNLLCVHLGPRNHAHMIEGYLEATDQEESFLAKLKRAKRLSSTLHDAKTRKYNIREIAWQAQTQLHRYACLGVVDPNDFVRDFHPIPLVGDERRIGHPLELGRAYAYFANRFLIRHECAHILLSDSGLEPIPEEFEADAMALSLGLSQAKGKREQIGACAGAFVFLLLAGWIERISDDQHFGNRHPPTVERVERLKQKLASMKNRREISPVVARELATIVSEIEGLFEVLWTESAILRDAQQAGSNSLRTAMDLAINGNCDAIFLDQIPRWLMFGAPAKLCLELAKYRCDLEHQANSGRSPDAAARLRILMQVYNIAEQQENSSLYEFLMSEYRAIQQYSRGSNGEFR